MTDPKIFHELRSPSTVSKCPENNRHSARCSNHEFNVSDGPRLEITYLESTKLLCGEGEGREGLENLMLGVIMRWTSIPFRGRIKILVVASCYANRR